MKTQPIVAGRESMLHSPVTQISRICRIADFLSAPRPTVNASPNADELPMANRLPDEIQILDTTPPMIRVASLPKVSIQEPRRQPFESVLIRISIAAWD
jgi:hypothetical protein